MKSASYTLSNTHFDIDWNLRGSRKFLCAPLPMWQDSCLNKAATQVSTNNIKNSKEKESIKECAANIL